MDDRQASIAMRRLSGQIATPPHLVPEARELKERGLMTFVEWPSGFWKITERGYALMMSISDEDA